MRAKIAGTLLTLLTASSAVSAPTNTDGFGDYVRNRTAPLGLSATDVLPFVQGGTTTALPLGALAAYLQANLPIITMLGFTPLAVNGDGSKLQNITPAQIGAQPALGYTPLAPNGSGAQLTGITAAQVGALAGTKSGSTAIFATVTGTLTNGHCVSLDGLGNLQDAGAACGSGSGGSGGSGSVASAQQNQVAYYPSASAAVAGLNLAGLTIANGALGVVYGTVAGTAAQGNDGRIVGALQSNYNLADVANPSTARANIGAAVSGANNDITSLSGLTTALSPAQGGTGVTSLPPGLIKGSGTTLAAAVPGTDYVMPGGALGTPSSATLTNATGLPLATGVTGALSTANGGTGASTAATGLANLGGLSTAGGTMLGAFQVLGGSATSLIDLQSTVPPNGFFTHPNGTYLQIVSVNGSPAGPHTLTQTLQSATTHLDGFAQELGQQFNFTNTSGYAPNWVPTIASTAWTSSKVYALGAYVTSNGSIFRATTGGTSAASGGGPGFYSAPGYGAVEPTASNVPDGSVVWTFVQAAVYQAYTGPKSSTVYNVTEISSNGNIYKNSVANCTPATSGTGPSGTGTAIADGTCSWAFVADGVNDGKSGTSLASIAGIGGGNHWGRVEAHQILPGFGSNVWYGNEEDTNNLNSDCYAGAPFFCLAHFQGGGSAYTFPIFAYNYIGSGAVNSRYNDGSASRNPYGAHYAYYISGQPNDVGSVAKDADFGSADNADIVIQALGGRQHAKAFLFDQSNSAYVLKATGTHVGGGVDLSDSTLGTAISLPNNGFISMSGSSSANTLAHFLGYNNSTGKLQFGLSTSNPQFTWDDNGNFTATGGILSSNVTTNGITAQRFNGSGTASLSGCGTSPSLQAGATPFSGIITEGTGASGCTVSFSFNYANPPACQITPYSGTPVSLVSTSVGALAYTHGAANNQKFAYVCPGL